MKERIKIWLEEESKILEKLTELYIHEIDIEKLKQLEFLILFHKTRILTFEQILN